MNYMNGTPYFIEGGPMPAEQVKALLQPYSGQIRQCITSGYEALERLRSRAPEECAPIPKRTLAGIIHAHMVYEARKAFSGMAPDVLLNESRGFLIVDFFGRVKLRFKRLSPRLHPSNIPTGQQRAVEDQTLFGPAVTLVTAGTHLRERVRLRMHTLCVGALRDISGPFRLCLWRVRCPLSRD